MNFLENKYLKARTQDLFVDAHFISEGTINRLGTYIKYVRPNNPIVVGLAPIVKY